MKTVNNLIQNASQGCKSAPANRNMIPGSCSDGLIFPVQNKLTLTFSLPPSIHFFVFLHLFTSFCPSVSLSLCHSPLFLPPSFSLFFSFPLLSFLTLLLSLSLSLSLCVSLCLSVGVSWASSQKKISSATWLKWQTKIPSL